ncbi:acyl-CoA N-acyltransferase [Polyplosphaeria fusca]|uniref:Acyl-CoA N-acyltransferase n=1 Tax=Polyplosphaeria fusca TaxID=682080 RepID=A0A9P4QMK6_9PLEO|nr:acyl-CoA N-acyltransferase [Polyplosphaeria fusca]
MEPVIDTPRLKLIRLTDTDASSQHAKWFYELHSDEGATSWSVAGIMKTPEQALEHMAKRVLSDGFFEYAVFVKPQPSELSQTVSPGDAGPEPGLLVGGDAVAKPVHVCNIGYGFMRSAWGKGYATEAATALLEAVTLFVKKERPEGFHYVEAGVGRKNPKSARVIEKLGLKQAGWRVEKEIIFLNGEWQEPGYWAYGKYV